MWLNDLRVIAIFAVVFLHVAANVVLHADITSTAWMIGNILNGSVRWAAPVFFILSGYLLLNPQKNDESVQEFYSKRIRKIGIAIVFWSILFLVFQILKIIFNNKNVSLDEHILLPLYYGKPYYHLWFLYTIAVLYLLTPLIRKFLTRFRIGSVFYAVIFLFFLASLENYFNTEKQFFLIESLSYLSYFLSGYLFRYIQEKKLYLIISLATLLISVIMTFSGTYFLVLAYGAATHESLFFYSYLNPTVIFMSLSVFYIAIHLKWTSNKLNPISKHAFGIYLIHPLILETFRFVGWKAEAYPPLISIPLITLAICGFSLLLSVIITLNKTAKKLTGI